MRAPCLAVALATCALACSPRAADFDRDLSVARYALMTGDVREARRVAEKTITLSSSLPDADRDVVLFNARVLRTQAILAGESIQDGLRACDDLFDLHSSSVTDKTLNELALSIDHHFDAASGPPASSFIATFLNEAVNRHTHQPLYIKLIIELGKLHRISSDYEPLHDIRPVDYRTLDGYRLDGYR